MSRRVLIYKEKHAFLMGRMMVAGCETEHAPQMAFLHFVNQGVTGIGV